MELTDIFGNIEERNSGYGNARGYDNEASFGRLIVDNVKDVAMTVLPNAPIDHATGLPVPTIAAATDGGVSVIKDDGNVYDITYTNFQYTKKTHFTVDNKIAVHTDTNTQTGSRFYRIYEIPSADLNAGAYNTHTDSLRSYGGDSVLYGYDLRYYWNGSGNWYAPHTIYGKDGPVFGEDNRDRNGIAIISENPNSPPNGLVCGINTDCNTGWMQGDIKGAFLSDTDTTNATYTTVADDWATASAWTKQSSISVSSTGSGTSGTLSITGNGTGSNVYFFNGISVEANTDYVVSVTFGAENANEFYINDTTYSTANKLIDINALSGLTRSGQFNTGSNTFLYIQGYQVSSSATTITSLVIQKVSEKDRSVNNKGLEVFGTVTKSAVATGAEVVAYSGWNDSNFLRQPYNTDLNFGTGDFSIMGWFKLPDASSTGFIIDRANLTTSGGGPRFAIYTESSQIKWYTFDGASNTEESSSIAGYDNAWIHFVCTRLSNGNQEIYLNGVLRDSRTGTSRDVNNVTGATTVIGHRFNAGNGATSSNNFDGSLALLRVTASIPSATQVKKMYRDEKNFFGENAKATLYGSSDAVTALAYDDDTELLHVGTSSGRSDFQGLCRINNTTTAVTTAISAHDEFIIEQ